MVNVEVICPHYFRNNRCLERFRAAIPEAQLYAGTATIRCPNCRKTIVLKNDRYYRILDKEVDVVGEEYDIHFNAMRTTKRGKYSAKQRKKQLRRIRRR